MKISHLLCSIVYLLIFVDLKLLLKFIHTSVLEVSVWKYCARTTVLFLLDMGNIPMISSFVSAMTFRSISFYQAIIDCFLHFCFLGLLFNAPIFVLTVETILCHSFPRVHKFVIGISLFLVHIKISLDTPQEIHYS